MRPTYSNEGGREEWRKDGKEVEGKKMRGKSRTARDGGVVRVSEDGGKRKEGRWEGGRRKEIRGKYSKWKR